MRIFSFSRLAVGRRRKLVCSRSFLGCTPIRSDQGSTAVVCLHLIRESPKALEAAEPKNDHNYPTQVHFPGVLAVRVFCVRGRLQNQCWRQLSRVARRTPARGAERLAECASAAAHSSGPRRQHGAWGGIPRAKINVPSSFDLVFSDRFSPLNRTRFFIPF